MPEPVIQSQSASTSSALEYTAAPEPKDGFHSQKVVFKNTVFEVRWTIHMQLQNTVHANQC